MRKSPLHEEDQNPPPKYHPSTSASSQAPLQKPLRSLLQQPADSGEESEAPKPNQKENSSESPKREPPARAPESAISSSESHFKSPGRNGAVGAKHLESALSRVPIGCGESSPEAAAAAAGGGMGKVMRVESGFVRREMLRRAEIGIRVSQVALCVVSFSVMAADRTAGWAGDYFERYLEYRYCFSVNVIASAYSAFQVCAHIYYMIWKKRRLSRSLSYSFDFLLDQVLAYLLLSASSSAATRHDDWVSMFGSDKFTDMLIGSITTSFFAFLAFAISSIISAYKLFGLNP